MNHRNPIRRVVAASRRRLHARKKERRKRVLRSFHEDPEVLAAAYFHFNGRSVRSMLEFSPRLLRKAQAFGYLSWPRKIASDIRGKDILDVGCGSGLHGLGSLVVGVRSYTGLDPRLDPTSERAKNRRTGERVLFGRTPRQLGRRFPRLRLLRGDLGQLALGGAFDVVVLHNATEHVLDLEEVLRACRECLRPGGLLIYNHHNYYCWNGHHMAPKHVDDIDGSDSRQRRFVDWQHLSAEGMADERLSSLLNRIRLDDLKALTEKLFVVKTWEERLSDDERGGTRLTDEIRIRHARYSERELSTQGVFCRGQRGGDVPSDDSAIGSSHGAGDR